MARVNAKAKPAAKPAAKRKAAKAPAVEEREVGTVPPVGGDLPPAAKADRAAALAVLRCNGVPDDLANLYADAWAEFVDATENVARVGSVCKHPRTGAPMENPYLRVRDRAFERLLKLRRKVNAAGLWR